MGGPFGKGQAGCRDSSFRYKILSKSKPRSISCSRLIPHANYEASLRMVSSLRSFCTTVPCFVTRLRLPPTLHKPLSCWNTTTLKGNSVHNSVKVLMPLSGTLKKMGKKVNFMSNFFLPRIFKVSTEEATVIT